MGEVTCSAAGCPLSAAIHAAVTPGELRAIFLLTPSPGYSCRRAVGSWRDSWHAEFAGGAGAPAVTPSRVAAGAGSTSRVVEFRDPGRGKAMTSEQQKLARKRFMSCKV